MIWEEYSWPVDPAEVENGNDGAVMIMAPRTAPLDGPMFPNKTGSTNGFDTYVAMMPSEEISVPGSPCFRMKAFWASVNFDAFIRFRSSPSQQNLAENSSFKRSSFQGAEQGACAPFCGSIRGPERTAKMKEAATRPFSGPQEEVR